MQKRPMEASRDRSRVQAGNIETRSDRFHQLRDRMVALILAVWKVRRFLPFGVVVVLVASFAVIVTYINHPGVPDDPDSPIYIYLASRVAHAQFVNQIRTPGYPLFIALVTSLAGASNMNAVSVAQGVLFVLASVGIYLLAVLLFDRAWVALLVTLPVAANVMLISYVKPIMTEALAIFLLVSLALALVWFVRDPRPRGIWLAMGLLFALAMTRPEWVYFSVPFVAFLLLVAWRANRWRHVLPHAGLALLVFLVACGVYAYGNSRHGYFGFSANQNADLLGKVMQYHMQHEASPQYAALTQKVDVFLAQGDYDPWHVINSESSLLANWYAVPAAYGRSIILAHPIEFVANTIPVVFQSLRSSDPHGFVEVNGPFSGVVFFLQLAASVLQYTLLLIPFIVLGWWVRLVRPRQASDFAVIMGGLSLLCAYPLAVTTLFVYAEYARMNVTYEPLMFVVVWLTILYAAQHLVNKTRIQLRKPTPS